MDYKIRFGRTAEKYLDNQTAKTRQRLLDAIHELPKGDVTKLKGREGYRITVGGFRVLFDFVDTSIIKVITIAPRGDVYKK